VRVATWLGRRMPPYAGTPAEKRALAEHLARLGGDENAGLEDPAPAGDGAAVFEQHCSACHGPESAWPIGPRLAARAEAELFELLGRLPQVREEMPPFSGSDEERRALAQYLAELATAPGSPAPEGEVNP
jgi:mono/diheme cytochrome c family protein